MLVLSGLRFWERNKISKSFRKFAMPGKKGRKFSLLPLPFIVMHCLLFARVRVEKWWWWRWWVVFGLKVKSEHNTKLWILDSVKYPYWVSLVSFRFSLLILLLCWLGLIEDWTDLERMTDGYVAIMITRSIQELQLQWMAICQSHFMSLGFPLVILYFFVEAFYFLLSFPHARERLQCSSEWFLLFSFNSEIQTRQKGKHIWASDPNPEPRFPFLYQNINKTHSNLFLASVPVPSSDLSILHKRQ